jgi:hypothetical protein
MTTMDRALTPAIVAATAFADAQILPLIGALVGLLMLLPG